MLLAAGALDHLSGAWSTRGVRSRAIALYGLLAVCFGLVTSAIGLNYVAGVGRSGENHAAIARKLRSVVPAGSRVYVFGWQPYFIGRQLDWRLYSFLPNHPKQIFRPEARDLLAGMDYVLAQERSNALVEHNDRSPLTEDEKAQLLAHGFQPVLKVDVPENEPIWPINRLRPVVFAWKYPAFTLWRKLR